MLTAIRRACRVDALTTETHDRGRDIAEHYKLSLYDAMIVASALLAGCRTLYSEDLHAGLKVDRSVSVRNPFT